MIKTLFATLMVKLGSAALAEDAQITKDCQACLDKSWKQCLKGNDFTVGKCCNPSASSGSADYCDPSW